MFCASLRFWEKCSNRFPGRDLQFSRPNTRSTKSLPRCIPRQRTKETKHETQKEKIQRQKSRDKQQQRQRQGGRRQKTRDRNRRQDTSSSTLNNNQAKLGEVHGGEIEAQRRENKGTSKRKGENQKGMMTLSHEPTRERGSESASCTHKTATARQHQRLQSVHALVLHHASTGHGWGSDRNHWIKTQRRVRHEVDGQSENTNHPCARLAEVDCARLENP